MGSETNGAGMTPAFGLGLQLSGPSSVLIQSLDDAAAFLRGYRGRWPRTEELILQLLEVASTDTEKSEAARTFRWWARLEGLLRRAD
jgi:hypothetical protein